MKKIIKVLFFLAIAVGILIFFLKSQNNATKITGFESYVANAQNTDLKFQLCVFNENAVSNKKSTVQRGIEIKIITEEGLDITLSGAVTVAQYDKYNAYCATIRDKAIANTIYQESMVGQLKIATDSEDIQMMGSYLFTYKTNMITVIFVPNVPSVDASLYNIQQS